MNINSQKRVLKIKKIKVKIKEKERSIITINTEFIRLDSLLKLANAVQTGGHAKIVIQEAEVKVNGEICLLRGKKLRNGDTAEFHAVIYEVKNES